MVINMVAVVVGVDILAVVAVVVVVVMVVVVVVNCLKRIIPKAFCKNCLKNFIMQKIKLNKFAKIHTMTESVKLFLRKCPHSFRYLLDRG